MSTSGELLDEGMTQLRAAGLETPRLDAELLLAHVLHVDRTTIIAHPDALVGDGAAESFRSSLKRRASGEPVAYLRGVKEFHGIAFMADPRALIPRPETELLVDLGITEVMSRLTAGDRPAGAPGLRVLDCGTGSGAIAVSIAVDLRRRRVPPHEVSLVAVDISRDALDLARENAVGQGVGDRIHFAAADLMPPTDPEPWDLILANLPYVRAIAMASLGPPTSFEPALALDGGADGLDVIRRLVEMLPARLAVDGVALLEIGADQAAGMGELVGERLAGWACRIVPDLAGLPRVARLERSSERSAARSV